MNIFWQPGVSVINTASIFCYMNLSFKLLTMSSNTYFLNYVCQTQPQSRHLVDSSIALFSQYLILPNVYAFSLFKLLITPMGFPRLGTACDPKTPHECTPSKLKHLHHPCCVISHCRPQETGGLKCWLQFPGHQVIWRSVICRNS
jgi:hypothetical protein